MADPAAARWLSSVVEAALLDAREAGLSAEECCRIVLALGRAGLPRWSARLSARAAAKAALPLDGADAQALEHALSQVEVERDAARRELASLRDWIARNNSE